MILYNNVVLVLGAGASQPYEFPTGDQIKDQMVECLKSDEFMEQIIQELGLSPFSGKEAIEVFRKEIDAARSTSIDKFIARQGHVNKRRIAKMAIAKILLEKEDLKILDRRNSWYLELYKILDRDSNLSTFGDNKISIITFNYDRSLEYFLFSRLEGDYGKERRDEIIIQLKKLKIIHINGCLGVLPWQHSHGCLEYAQGRKFYRYSMIVDGLRIVGEPDGTVNDRAIISEAQEVISTADQIYFLGLGYDKRNLDLLNLELINECNLLFGTRYGLTSHLQDVIASYFEGKLKFYPTHYQMYEFIQDFAPDREYSPVVLSKVDKRAKEDNNKIDESKENSLI